MKLQSVYSNYPCKNNQILKAQWVLVGMREDKVSMGLVNRVKMYIILTKVLQPRHICVVDCEWQ